MNTEVQKYERRNSEQATIKSILDIRLNNEKSRKVVNFLENFTKKIYKKESAYEKSEENYEKRNSELAAIKNFEICYRKISPGHYEIQVWCQNVRRGQADHLILKIRHLRKNS